MAILRSLLVNLGLNSSQYRSDLKKSKNETKANFAEMAKAGAEFAAKSTAAFATATAAIVTSNAKMIRDQQNMANIANMTLGEYQKLSYAAQQYGVTAEQISDISKDTLEKIGEYINAGSGGLQDFADAMNMSKEKTLEWARSVQGMSGQQILQKMITEMEQAGLSSEQMSNALESLGNDTTKLIPLFRNNGQELDRLTKKYSSFNEELSQEQIDKYRMAAEDIDLLTTSLQNMLNVALVPVLSKIYETGKAWQWLMASFEKGTVQNLTSEMADLVEQNKSLEAAIAKLEARGWDNFFADDQEMIAKHRKQIEMNTEQYEELRKKLIQVQGLDLPTGEEKDLVINVRPVVKRKTMFEEELEKPKDKDKTFEEEYAERYESLDAWAEYYSERNRMAQEAAEEQAKQELNLQKIMMDATQGQLSAMKSATDGLMQYAKEGSTIAKLAFVASQALAASQVFVSAEQAKWAAASTIPNAAAQAAVMASIDAQKYVSLGLIAAQTGAGLAGQFHDGGTIPREGTYLLDGGETVYTRQQHEQLMRSIGGGGSSMNVTVDLRGTTGDKALDDKLKQSALSAYRMVINDARSNGPAYKAMRK